MATGILRRMEALTASWSTQLTVLLTVAYAMALGGLIGWERELKDRPAGFRTHMLIAGAAALLVGLGDLLGIRFSGNEYRELVRVDPLRVIEAVVAAVGFLGAGAIFRRTGGSGVSGLTTAASMLMAAAIGIATGLHGYLLAIGVTLLTLAVLWLLRILERRIEDRRERKGE